MWWLAACREPAAPRPDRAAPSAAERPAPTAVGAPSPPRGGPPPTPPPPPVPEGPLPPAPPHPRGVAFRATVYASIGHGVEAAMAGFDAAGCHVAGTEARLAREVAQAVEAPDLRWYGNSTSGFGRIDPESGRLAEVRATGVDLGNAMSTALDAATGHVLVATLSGEGVLADFDPATGALVARGSMSNVDAAAIAVTPDGAELVALEVSRGEPFGSLVRLDARTGFPRGRLALSPPVGVDGPEDEVRGDPRRVVQLRYTPAGELVALVRSWEGAPVRTLRIAPDGAVSAVACP